MGQVLQESLGDDEAEAVEVSPPPVAVIPSLFVAIVCTALIAEAVVTVVHGRANGDLMVMVCPILGAMFLSLPTARAWWNVVKYLWGN